MYGTQAASGYVTRMYSFENDVKMYGTQARAGWNRCSCAFENDVKMYGTQAYTLDKALAR